MCFVDDGHTTKSWDNQQEMSDDDDIQIKYLRLLYKKGEMPTKFNVL